MKSKANDDPPRSCHVAEKKRKADQKAGRASETEAAIKSMSTLQKRLRHCTESNERLENDQLRLRLASDDAIRSSLTTLNKRMRPLDYEQFEGHQLRQLKLAWTECERFLGPTREPATRPCMSRTCQDDQLACLTDTPATIQKNNFVFKSLCNWALNFFIGCLHACRFCYVTDTSIRKIAKLVRSYGVADPVRDWGNYLLVRPWDRQAFLASLKKAEETPPRMLKPDGNRAVMLCSTTDAYPVIRHPDAGMRNCLQEHARFIRRESLRLIDEESTLNVRVLTRSPLAREDFDIFRSLGNRALLGTSLPTLDPELARVYEPKVPAPKQRLKLLLDAREAGINTFVAVAPVFPECDYEGLVNLFGEVQKAGPVTIFMEPVNLRLDIGRRIEEEAAKLGREIDMTPYTNNGAWADYAVGKLREAELAAAEAGVSDRLHLWPDRALGAPKVVQRQPDPEHYRSWLRHWWSRVSEWPGNPSR